MQINSGIFREYDIRGIVGEDLSEEFAETLGKAYGTYLQYAGTKDVLVARDARTTSLPYQNSLMQGLMSTGCNVYDLGIAIVSTMYYARQKFNIDGGVMVSASHNPPQYNGFKLCHGQNTISGEEIQKVLRIMQKGEFAKGDGKIIDWPQGNQEYYKELLEKVKLKKKLKVVFDSSAAISALFIPKLLEDMRCEVINLYPQLNPTNPPHTQDPAAIDAYEELIKSVKENNADVGVLFDGDADRVGFVDERGRIQLGDVILTLFVQDYLPRFKGSKVIVEIKDSEMVIDEVNRLGGVPILWKTGHSLLDEKVHEEKAILCGEMSCHYWIVPDWYEFDDAVHAMCQALRIISQSEKTFAEIVDTFPKYYATPEYRIGVPDDKKFEVVKKAVAYFRPLCTKVLDIDGIRGYTKDGWFLFRATNTGPLVAMRIEAKTPEGLERMKKMVEDGLRQFPEVHLDWNRQQDKH
jgi:phosphomannomutase / phosphoglucomutase